MEWYTLMPNAASATTPIVTRFAPSPTGFLHIGGARTALFNWLFARANDGKFLLRIEDTDRKRSTPEAIEAILDGMHWLGLDWDGDETYQFSRMDRHQEVVQKLLHTGKAYPCYSTPEELAALREAAQAEGKTFRYPGIWRDRNPADAPDGIAPAIRLKAPKTGETVVEDAVQGRVVTSNSEMDDMVLLRADGTPTYMLAVVVDDHDMGVTHIIRGDDHLTNAGRQQILYEALGWNVPIFAHIPLIHGADGAKLSKRHGALGVDAYREMGYLPEGLRNYLLRLGWSHGDDEIIPTEKAIEWFDLAHIGKSPSRMDFTKMAHVNGHYLREMPNAELVPLVTPFLETSDTTVTKPIAERLARGLTSLKQRANTLVELAEAVAFYTLERPIARDPKAQEAIDVASAKTHLDALYALLSEQPNWQIEALDSMIKQYVESSGAKFKDVGMPMRAALTGTLKAPGIGELLYAYGKDESLARLHEAVG